MQEKDLITFGLTPVEAKIYMIIVKNGSCQIGNIIKATQFHRGTIYNAITRLVEKGFISITEKDKKTYYNITNSKIFFDIIDRRLNELEKNKKIAQELTNIINSFKNLQFQSPRVQLLLGEKAFKNTFLEMFDYCSKNNKEYLFLGYGGEMRDAVGREYYRYTQQLKKKLKIKCRVILNEASKSHPYIKEVVGNIKFLSKEFIFPTSTWIYDSKVFMTIWNTQPVVTILFESKEVYESFKNYFELLWNHSYHGDYSLESRHKINFFELLNNATESLDIMGINCLIPIHEGKRKIISLLNNKKRVRILLLNPKSKAFDFWMKNEEPYAKTIKKSRMFFEWNSVISNLYDIHLRTGKTRYLEVKLYSDMPSASRIIIDNKILMNGYYQKGSKDYGSGRPSSFFTKDLNLSDFNKLTNDFENRWKKAKKFDLVKWASMKL